MAGRGPVGDQESIFEDDEEFSSGHQRRKRRVTFPSNHWRTCSSRPGATNPRRRADVAAVSETRVTAPSVS